MGLGPEGGGKVKIRADHLARLKTLIDGVLAAQVGGAAGVVEAYETGNFPRSNLVNDLQKRFCFDLWYAAMRGSNPLVRELYQYLNDEHLFTALKSICPRVVRKY